MASQPEQTAPSSFERPNQDLLQSIAVAPNRIRRKQNRQDHRERAHTFVINKTGAIVGVFDDSAIGTGNDTLISLLEKIREIESTTP